MTGDLCLILPYAMRVSTLPTWGECLRKARTARRWTQEDLAKEAGVGLTTIVNQENPKKGQMPTADVLRAECRALGISLIDALRVIYRVDDEPLPPPLPNELVRLVSLYTRLGPLDQRRVLDNVAIICDWLEPIVAASLRDRRVG
jgi:transcriptional regulator with XRE-family HTH domain